MTELSTKMKAALLLRKYDQLRQALRATEQELGKAVTDYARETGRWALSKDHFRSELEREAEHARIEQAAERHAWETANA
jgi:dsDNA-specific endonuclease/ATPase MutS2